MNIFPEFTSTMNNFPEKDSEMDSEMSSCCCFLLRLLFVQKTAHARGGCQGASGFVHSPVLLLICRWGIPFFWSEFGNPFFHQKMQFWRKIASNMNPKWGLLEAIFGKSAKTEKCVSTAPARTDCIWAHPVERSGRLKNRRKKGTYLRTAFFSKKYEKYEKRAPKGLQMGDFISGVAPLWRLLGHLWCPQPFWASKMSPQRP